MEPSFQTMNRFENQIAIVTGGTSGLGLAITRRLQSEGALVFTFDLASRTVETITDDVTNESQLKAAIEQIITQRGRIDILVNCAGVTGKTNIKSHEVTLDDFEFVMRTN